MNECRVAIGRVAVTPYNPQLQRTVIRPHVRAASAARRMCVISLCTRGRAGRVVARPLNCGVIGQRCTLGSAYIHCVDAVRVGRG